MLATVQRVSSAEVSVKGLLHSFINKGIVIFICIETTDTIDNVKKMKEKIHTFKILDEGDKTMSSSLKNINEDIMIISQFTLAAITSKGSKASFHKSAKPKDAKLLYDEFVNEFKKEKNKIVEGVFGEYMDVSLTNKGPITFNFKV